MTSRSAVDLSIAFEICAVLKRHGADSRAINQIWHLPPGEIGLAAGAFLQARNICPYLCAVLEGYGAVFGGHAVLAYLIEHRKLMQRASPAKPLGRRSTV